MSLFSRAAASIFFAATSVLVLSSCGVTSPVVEAEEKRAGEQPMDRISCARAIEEPRKDALDFARSCYEAKLLSRTELVDADPGFAHAVLRDGYSIVRVKATADEVPRIGEKIVVDMKPVGCALGTVMQAPTFVEQTDPLQFSVRVRVPGDYPLGTLLYSGGLMGICPELSEFETLKAFAAGLEGEPLNRALAAAEEKKVRVQVISTDGQAIPVTTDWVPSRISISTEGGRVVAAAVEGMPVS